MYNVSTGFLTAIKQNAREVDAKIVIGATEIPSDGIIEFSLEESFGANKMPTIGGATSTSIQLKLDNTYISLLQLINVPIKPYVAVKVNGVYEWIPMGVFYAENVDVTIDKVTTTIEAFDKMDKLDRETYESTLTFPSTTTAMLAEIANNYGITHTTPTSKAFNVKPTGTVRQVIGLIAMVQSANAMFDKTGKLVFKFKNDTTFTIDSNSYIDYTMLTKSLSKITQLRLKGKEEVDDIIVGDSTGVAIEMTNVGITTEAQVQGIHSAAYPFYFQPYTMELQGMPHLEVGDTFTFIDVDSNTSTLMICHHSFQYNGGFKSKYEVEAPKTGTDKLTVTQTGGTSISEGILDISKNMLEVIKASTALITGNVGGHIVIKPNENGQPEEILIMDTTDINTAMKVWRWNSSGLGYSSTGYNGEYALAITADGSIVADFITTGILSANRIRAGVITSVDGLSYWNLDTGEIVLNVSSMTINSKQPALQEDLDALITGTDVEYYLSTSSTAPTGGTWLTTAPDWTNGMFMWSRTKITYHDTSVIYRPSETGTNITGATGSSGVDGVAGRSISSVAEQYYHSTSPTTLTGGSWSETVPTWSKTKYIWTSTVVTYANPAGTFTSTPISVSGQSGIDGYTPIKGTDYFDGVDGNNGSDGASSYLWVRYSQNANGSPMTTDATGAKYVGIATTTVNIAPSGYASYKWSLIKGTAGVKGETGANGQTSYLHIKYSNDGGTTFTANTGETVGEWIGTYVDFTEADSTLVSKYTWNKVKGDTGERGPQGTQGPQGATGLQGPRGNTGTSVESVTEYYLATSVSSGILSTNTGFKTTMQSMTASNKYLWNYEQINFSDGTSQPTIPVIIGVYGDKGQTGGTGATGATGRSIVSITENYLATSASSGVTRSTSGWDTAIQPTTETNRYLWNYETITWNVAPLTTYVEPIIIGVHGDKGDKGDSGISISSVDVQYQNSTSSTIAPTGTWSTTANWEANKFTWSRVKTTYTSGNPTYSLPAVITGSKGDKGDEGNTGATGKGISSTVITYQASTSGTSTPTGSWVTTIPNVAENQFLWTRTTITHTDAQVVHAYSVGKMGAKGTTGNTGNDGRGISSTVITYQVSTSGTAIPSSWQSSIPTVAENEFLWTRTTLNYTSGNPTHAYSVGKMGAKGDKGTTGSTGATGRGISSIIEEYYLSDSKTTQTGSSWKLSPDPWVINKYMWTRSKINYTTGTPTFEHTTPLVSSEWEAINEIEIGGRNYWAITKEPWHSYLTHQGDGIFTNNTATTSYAIFRMDKLEVPVGETYTLSFEVNVSDDTIQFSNNTFYVNSAIPSVKHNRPTLVKDKWAKVYATFNYTVENTTIVHIYFSGISTVDTFQIRNFKLEKGNKATDWTPAPEDVEASIGEKADNSDLNNLGVIVGELSSEISSKADEGELTALINRYNNRIEEEIINKQEVSDSLSTLEGRTNAVEFILGEKTAKWEFIETTITQSNEGIFIGNEGTQMGVLVGTDRISFMDKGIEVAYISNKTMQINHGIFVESAVIGKHMIETISGTDITVFTYIG